MPYSVHYESQGTFLSVVYTGELNLGTIEGALEEGSKIAFDHHCRRILINCTGAALNLSIVDIYNLPTVVDKIIALAGDDARLARMALIAGDRQEDYAFFETVCQNRMQNVKLFHSIEPARQWMLSAA